MDWGYCSNVCTHIRYCQATTIHDVANNNEERQEERKYRHSTLHTQFKDSTDCEYRANSTITIALSQLTTIFPDSYFLLTCVCIKFGLILYLYEFYSTD